MNTINWYVNVAGQIIGPFSTQNLEILLERNRVSFLDFAWAPGLPLWYRLHDFAEFSHLHPEYPAEPVPNVSTAAAEPVQTREEERKQFEESAAENGEDSTHLHKWRRTRADRVDIVGQVDIEGIGTVDITNISETGAFMLHPDPPPIGFRLGLKIRVPDTVDVLEIVAVVARHGLHKGSDGFGIEFVKMSSNTRKILLGYIKDNI